MGLLFGAAFGVAQGPLLRGLDERAVVRWSVANALGWAVGLVWLFVAASIPDDGWPTGLIIVLAAAAGALAGLSVGAITGAALVRMHRE
jgi:hypothetical protein